MVDLVEMNDGEDARSCRLPATRSTASVGETIAADQHYTPAELGKAWHCSPNTIRRYFHDEPGVLKITAGPAPARNTRRRRMVQLRIPARVAIRVHARLSN